MAAEVDYNDASATYNIPIYQNTFVLDVLVDITTAFTGGSTATIAIGDSAAANNYLQTGDITVTATGIVKASGQARTNAKGKLYTANDNIKVAFTQNATDAAGVALILVQYVYLPDGNSGALVAGTGIY
jgi:hypothetical protein